MEDLNKQQLILLVLLVSFVTSIATGIITVSLLDKAPVAVTQTINRVVERTVETVVPDNLEPQERVVTVRETVVVTEEDRVVEAISKNKKSIVRVVNNAGTFLAIGFIRTAEGEVLVSGSGYSSVSDYTARFDNGEEIPLNYEKYDEQSGVAYFTLQPEDERVFAVSSVATEDLQLGQSVVAMSGSDRSIIATGRVIDVESGVSVATDMNTTNMNTGTILINLSGDVVAILNPSDVFVPMKKIVAIKTSEGQEGNTASAGQSVR
jgi:hypothetical protein